MKTSKPTDVSSYIAHAPHEIQSKLREIRKAIKETAPKAEEKISYGIPYYHYNARLVYFAYATSHIGLYVPGGILEQYKNELKNYSTTKATLRLPFDEKIPTALLKKLVRARMKVIDSKK